MSPRCDECRAIHRSITAKAACKKYQERHRDKRLLIHKTPEAKKRKAEYRQLNREACHARSKAWLDRPENKQRKNKTNKEWKSANRIRNSLVYKKWSENNKDKNCAKTMKYYADKMKACPPWADLKEIGRIYADAQRISQETGIKHHVDHIYPLRSKILCGLHVPSNLRVIPWIENVTKSNYKWPGYGMPELPLEEMLQ